MNLQLIGLAAGLFSTIGFVPQVVKALKTRSTGDLSLWMILILVTGAVLWFTYGFVIHDPPILIANGATGSLLLMMLFLKLRYR